MRTSGLCLALLASAPVVLLSTSAFAQDNDTSSSAPAPAPAPAADKPADTKAAPSTGSSDGTVVVHINSDTPVTLQHRSGESAAWETLCTSPCDAKAPVADQYQIAGEGLNASKPFMLDSSKGKVTLDVSAGSHSKATVGTGFLIGGGVVALTGLVWLILESTGPLHADTNSPGFVSGTSDGGTTHTEHTNAIFAAGALVFAGVAAGLYGAGTMLANNHSDVQGDVAKDQPAKGQMDLPARTGQIAVPNTAFMVPVLHGTF